MFRSQSGGCLSLQATSPAACPRFSGLEPETDSTSEKPPRTASGVPSKLEPCLLEKSFGPANEINNPNDVPAIS
ncbi:hypothetical protein DSO57_1018529 [Entomophthora muscae]|uniref:Uncharacterized protein n=1 Tax=Entomophthora muscae TaxID=34485 RepID=A0ACC2U2L8_9FUNG|nr:hypothetical protein DSO57_1018529 [Entomophthora muscae]